MRSGHQTKTGALVEVVASTTIGFFVSWAVWWWIVVPLYDVETTALRSVGATAIFTVSSLIRSYVWRRIMTRPVGESS